MVKLYTKKEEARAAFIPTGCVPTLRIVSATPDFPIQPGFVMGPADVPAGVTVAAHGLEAQILMRTGWKIQHD